MLGLIPAEMHCYSVRDIMRGLAVVLKHSESQDTISLPGLGLGIPIRSARAAVIVAIKALCLKQGASIGVPLYCCPVVFKAVREAGCVPCFIDIDSETYCLSLEDLKRKCSRLDSLIAVHMFGNTCDMVKISEIMKGKPVIEDCAQSLGSSIGGRLCGSFGDISFFSFRSGKYLSVGEGGALYSEKTDLFARISNAVSAFPVPTRLDEFKHIIEIYLRSKLRSRPLWGLVGSRIWALYNKTTEFFDKSPIALGRIFLSDMAMVFRRMPQLDFMINLQRENAGAYERNLLKDATIVCREWPGHFYNRFMYPIMFVSSDMRDAMAVYLKGYGIGSSKPYEEVIKGAASHYDYKRDCPVAEQALMRTLVIPSFYTLKPRLIQRIIRAFNQGMAEIKSGGQ